MTNNEAASLIKKSLAVLSKRYDCELKLNVYGDGTSSIVNETDCEIVHHHPTDWSSYFKNHVTQIYFNSTLELLDYLMSPKHEMCFHPIGKDAQFICFAKELGSTVDELQVNLDLQN